MSSVSNMFDIFYMFDMYDIFNMFDVLDMFDMFDIFHIFDIIDIFHIFVMFDLFDIFHTFDMFDVFHIFDMFDVFHIFDIFYIFDMLICANPHQSWSRCTLFLSAGQTCCSQWPSKLPGKNVVLVFSSFFSYFLAKQKANKSVSSFVSGQANFLENIVLVFSFSF